MKLIVEIDEARFKDVQRITEVQLEMSHFQTAEQIIAKGIPLEQYEVRQNMFYYLNGVADGLHESRRDTIDVLDKIRAEIEKAVWEDSIVSLDGTDEVRIPLLDPDDVLQIINKYKAETE